MECLEDNRSAAVHMSIDLVKAFNCMDHLQCIQNLVQMGASNQTVAKVASFLKDRKMKIKLPGLFSTLKSMPGGAPQGTKSRNFLFCVSIAGLEEGSLELPPFEPPPPQPGQEIGQYGLLDIAQRLRPETDSDRPSSPIGGTEWDRRLRHKRLCWEDTDDELEDDPLDSGSLARRAHHIHPDRWTDLPVKSSKFIDDLNGREKCDMKKEVRLLHARKLDRFFLTVRNTARSLGMKVNTSKTQLICTSAAINYDVRAYVEVDGSKLLSGDILTTVGYTLGKRPGPGAHIKKDKNMVREQELSAI